MSKEQVFEFKIDDLKLDGKFHNLWRLAGVDEEYNVDWELRANVFEEIITQMKEKYEG